MDFTIKNGKRFGAYNAFLYPILYRENLHIRRYAQVIKVNLDKNRRAYGVTYFHHGRKTKTQARKEIILSAGAIDSPKILMLSGIGPKTHLDKIGIKTLVDLPVGKNLQDHVMVTLGPFNLKNGNATWLFSRDFTVSEGFRYLTTGTGLISTSLGISAVAYIYSSLALQKMQRGNLTSENVSPDIQLVLLPVTNEMLTDQEQIFNFVPGYLSKFLSTSKLQHSFYVYVMLGKYKSKGEITLASKDPNDKPIINPKYFSHPDDIKVLVDGINFTVTMIEQTKAFKRHKARLIDRQIPGCEKYKLRSLSYYECLARHWTLTVYHHSGTCSMGKNESDVNAVVDSELRVLNTTGLRVVDAAIIPEIPNCNTNAVVYMIADKASEMILNHWKAYKRN